MIWFKMVKNGQTGDRETTTWLSAGKWFQMSDSRLKRARDVTGVKY